MRRSAADIARRVRSRLADGGSVSEDEVQFGGSPIDEFRRTVNTRKFTPEQAAENRQRSAIELASNLPGPGNVLAAKEAWDASGRGGEALLRGAVRDAAAEYANMGLNIWGAVTGRPSSRAAGDAAQGASTRANTFIPVTQPRATQIAKESQAAGEPSQLLYENTGTTFAPDGTLRRVLSDAPMQYDPKAVQSYGTGKTIGDVVEHPELFDKFPGMDKLPVTVVPGAGPASRGPAGGVLLFKDNPDNSAEMLKSLQYKVSEQSGFGKAFTHDFPRNIEYLENVIKRAENLGTDAGKLYAANIRQKVNEALQLANRAGDVRASQKMNPRVLGNIDTKMTRHQWKDPSSANLDLDPYQLGQNGRGINRDSVIVVPQVGNDTVLNEFVERWRKHGTGRDFASGGTVRGAASKLRKRLAVGAMTGDTGGREDALPVKAAEGSYVVPADIVASLGEGNSLAGFKLLKSSFPGKRVGKFNPKGVDIIVSDGEFVIAPEDVSKLGNNDLKRGHAALDNFVRSHRSSTIKKLQAIPGPKT